MSALNQEDRANVGEFLKQYRNPALISSATIKDGYVVRIKPIPTICGAEIMCSPKTMPALREFVEKWQQETDHE